MSRKQRVLSEWDAWKEQNPLRKWRNKDGLIRPQSYIAVMLSCSAQTIRNYESGATTPPPRAIEDMASMMGRSSVKLGEAWKRWMKKKPTA